MALNIFMLFKYILTNNKVEATGGKKIVEVASKVGKESTNKVPVASSIPNFSNNTEINLEKDSNKNYTNKTNIIPNKEIQDGIHVPNIAIKSSTMGPDMVEYDKKKENDSSDSSKSEEDNTTSSSKTMANYSEEDQKKLKDSNKIFVKKFIDYCNQKQADPLCQTPKNLQDPIEILRDQLLHYKLLSTDNLPTITYVETISGKTIALGKHKGEKKLTKLGYAYLKQEEVKIKDENILKIIDEVNDYKFEIAIAPQHDFDEAIPNGKKGHLLIVLTLGEKSLIIGYLTSTKTVNLVCETQYKDFIKKHGDKIIEINQEKKKQYFSRLSYGETIKTNKLEYPIDGNVYLEKINKDDLFRKVSQDLFTKDIFVYDPNNYTLVQIKKALEKCIYNEKYGLMHPKTEFQIEQEHFAKEKQKAKQQDEKQKKNLKQEKQEDDNLVKENDV